MNMGVCSYVCVLGADMGDGDGDGDGDGEGAGD